MHTLNSAEGLGTFLVPLFHLGSIWGIQVPIQIWTLVLETILKAHEQELYTGWMVKLQVLGSKYILSHKGWITERDVEKIQVIL